MDLIANVRRAIPAHCFVPSYGLSLFYMIRDLCMFATAAWVYPILVQNSGFVTHFLYWNLYGFLGWCIFVIGHDCGHNSFSKSYILNGICGHLCHTVIMVPFYPWARSHHSHHVFHNHKENDRSHPWNTEKELIKYPWIARKIVTTIIMPFVGFWVYLYYETTPDGSHMVWFGRLYAEAPTREKIKAAISILSVVLWFLFTLVICGDEYWLSAYGGILVMTYFWLFMVTWLQHHDERTLVYDADTWNFAKGALQTVDRQIGFGIDQIHHHISNCHIVHHMFFTSIPHYHLHEATKHLYAYGIANDISLKVVDHSAYFGKYVIDFLRLYPKINVSKWSWGK